MPAPVLAEGKGDGEGEAGGRGVGAVEAVAEAEAEDIPRISLMDAVDADASFFERRNLARCLHFVLLVVEWDRRANARHRSWCDRFHDDFLDFLFEFTFLRFRLRFFI